jgi:hypothetical protein
MKSRRKKIKLSFTGVTAEHDLLIGSHGNTDFKVRGNFELSGIIYCPKYTVMLDINGSGRIAFRGKCYSIVIRKMHGNCILDLTNVTCKELHCDLLGGNSVVFAGNVRAITPAILSDKAVLHVSEHQLIFNPVTSGDSKILTTSGSKIERIRQQLEVKETY